MPDRLTWSDPGRLPDDPPDNAPDDTPDVRELSVDAALELELFSSSESDSMVDIELFRGSRRRLAAGFGVRNDESGVGDSKLSCDETEHFPGDSWPPLSWL